VTASAPLELIVLSPHLDDAVLSCGGRIAAITRAGGRALTVTPFAGDEPETSPSRLAGNLRRSWQLPAGQVVAARRREDDEAGRRLGAETEHWTLREALYRTDAGGHALYASHAALYGEPAAADAATAEEVTKRICNLPATALLLVPLAVGGHVDHRLVRAAAERSGRTMAYYEDFPYSEWKWFGVRRALDSDSSWSSEALPLSPDLLELRKQAILAYSSQVRTLFRSAGRLGKQLRRAARRAGGERIWRRDSIA
jgi:LmbE family N-acetylglucosaminyl deacetylase